MIPYGRQSINQQDIDAVKAVLESPFLTQGPAVPAFEQAIAERVEAAYGVAVANATAALHLCCLALGLQAGDRLWTVPNTFVASANCGRYCGAEVDFVDIDPHSYCMSVTDLQVRLQQAALTNRLPKIVIPVHFAGQSCDMAAIWQLAQQYGFKVIEDASHAIGGRYRQRPIGCGQYSHATVFSFHPVKIITTAEGGMVTTNDPELAARIGRLRSHGITREPELMTQAADGPWYYQQLELGFNYRLTDIQAALGLSQLSRLSTWVARRAELAAQYDQQLAGLPLICPWQDPQTQSAWHLYVIQVAQPERRLRLFEQLRAAGIGVNLHYIPVHLQPYYQQLGFKLGDYPVSEAYYQRAISLPLFPELSQTEQQRVIQVLAESLA